MVHNGINWILRYNWIRRDSKSTEYRIWQTLYKTSTLLKEGFYDVLVRRDSQKQIRIQLEKTYMMYEKIPTYHTISYFPDGYEISNTSQKKMISLKNWYLLSSDDKEDENEVEFLDIMSLLRYDEAIAFQKKKRRNKK